MQQHAQHGSSEVNDVPCHQESTYVRDKIYGSSYSRHPIAKACAQRLDARTFFEYQRSSCDLEQKERQTDSGFITLHEQE